MKAKIVAEQILRELDILYDSADIERVSEILRKAYESAEIIEITPPPDITAAQRDVLIQYLKQIDLALAPTKPWVN